MIKKAIQKLTKKQNLTFNEAKNIMDLMMTKKVTLVQIASYLTALSMKGESVEEITACALSMRSYCKKFPCDYEVLEIVGTGGDGAHSFNISTASAILVSSLGVKVAKHGNRASSSKCGSADVLEALGININLSPKQSKELLEKSHFCFLFAQDYHTSMQYVAPVRKELGIKTIFNILGPLSNPANANMELMGVYDESLVEPLAKVLQNLGVKSAMVVYGCDGLDEISISDKTKVCEIKGDEFRNYFISPLDFGYQHSNKEELKGGDAAKNARILRDIFTLKEKGAKRAAVCLNAGAALYIAKKVPDVKSGVLLAEKTLDDKKALYQLETLIKESNKKGDK